MWWFTVAKLWTRIAHHEESRKCRKCYEKFKKYVLRSLILLISKLRLIWISRAINLASFPSWFKLFSAVCSRAVSGFDSLAWYFNSSADQRINYGKLFFFVFTGYLTTLITALRIPQYCVRKSRIQCRWWSSRGRRVMKIRLKIHYCSCRHTLHICDTLKVHIFNFNDHRFITCCWYSS